MQKHESIKTSGIYFIWFLKKLLFAKAKLNLFIIYLLGDITLIFYVSPNKKLANDWPF